MSTKSALTRRLTGLAGFENPRPDLEQYRTPAEVAAHLVHTADLHDDIAGRVVVDLGCGTGTLGLAAALRGPARVVGVDVDPGPLGRARANERRIAPEVPVSWIRGDVTRRPLSPPDATTVVMNPPFGAQRGNEHADREFLATTAAVADVSYSIHNADSMAFVESFAADNGGELTHAFAVEFDLPRSFPFHDDGTRTIDAEAFRIEWD